MTTEEAATLAGVDPAVLRKWVLRGDLVPVRRGAKPLRFWYDDVCRVQRDKRGKTWLERHDTARREWVATESVIDVAR